MASWRRKSFEAERWTRFIQECDDLEQLREAGAARLRNEPNLRDERELGHALHERAERDGKLDL